MNSIARQAWISLRISQIKRSKQLAASLPAAGKILVYPGDAIMFEGHRQDGDHTCLTGVTLRNERIDGAWFIYNPAGHAQTAWHAQTVADADILDDSAAALMYKFLSLGENCEFSFIQRRAGAEPLEMLRFTGTQIEQLIIAFQEEFSAVGEPAHTRLTLSHNDEIWCMNDRYGFEQHMFLPAEQWQNKKLLAEQYARLKFLRRKFLEELRLGEKILVYKQKQGAPDSIARQLFEAVSSSGSSPLLCVAEDASGTRAGQVELLEPGFMKGYLSRFAPLGQAALGNLGEWLSICRIAAAYHKT